MKNQSEIARKVLGTLFIATLLGAQSGCAYVEREIYLHYQRADMEKYTSPIDLTKAGNEVDIDFKTQSESKLRGWVVGIILIPKCGKCFNEDDYENLHEELDEMYKSVTGWAYRGGSFGIPEPHKKIKAKILWVNKDLNTISKQGVYESDDVNGSYAANAIGIGRGYPFVLDHFYLQEGLQPNTNYQVRIITVQDDDRFNLTNFSVRASLGYW